MGAWEVTGSTLGRSQVRSPVGKLALRDMCMQRGFGKWIKEFTVKVRKTSSFVVELWDFGEGLLLVKSMDMENVED